MIESLQNQPQTIALNGGKPAKNLRYVENDRMGGKIPVWEVPKTAKQHIEANLENAQKNGQPTTESALSYTGT